MPYDPKAQLGTYQHVARECVPCAQPQQPFYRPKGSSDPLRCTACEQPERGAFDSERKPYAAPAVESTPAVPAWALAPVPAEPPPYRVEQALPACDACGGPPGFDVIGPDGVALSTTYNEREDADCMAESLNDAYELGFEAARVRDAAEGAEQGGEGR